MIKLALVCINKAGMDDYSLIHTQENKINIVYATDANFYFYIFLLGASLRIVPGPRSTNHTEMFFGRNILFSCPSAEQQEPQTSVL